MTSTAEAATQFRADWERWHAAHETQRAAPQGFLAVTGLHWLGDEPTRFAGVPGAWSTGEDGPVVHLDEGESLTVDGTRVRGRHAFGPIPERGGLTVSDARGVVEIARRGGHDILRPRRADHPFLATYEGTPTYEADPRWAVTARFTAYDTPRETTVGAAVEGLSHVYDSPGYLTFAWEGRDYDLVALPGHGPGDLLVLFTDDTSGRTTYAANRAIAVSAPDAQGATVIDFNRAVNLPCAYTDFATCPLPPRENRLPFAVEAGERTPRDRVLA